ncbi:Protein CBG16415 [Caenorhabditis briggsae]|uniref:Protein CBG16415 n=1 Tax=Caenorhabditis briggsae TaxID=6238 RepID=A8XNH8_CAEBR|nr:Protein CBG16415 [Caenorhabditis briggsae]CAP34067.1 Protein CBG16415 [Caenorhabditis briggsae]
MSTFVPFQSAQVYEERLNGSSTTEGQGWIRMDHEDNSEEDKAPFGSQPITLLYHQRNTRHTTQKCILKRCVKILWGYSASKTERFCGTPCTTFQIFPNILSSNGND